MREQRGLTLDDAATLLNLSKSALNRMENAQVVVRPYQVNYLLMMYGIIDKELTDSLLGLAAAGRSKDWIKRHRALTGEHPSTDLVRLEQDSRAIRLFQPWVIPGLFQTPGYARAVMTSVPPTPGRDLERSVAYRMARKEVLTRAVPAEVRVVIGEAALRQRYGCDEVMREQLRHLLGEAGKPNVTVQVLPFDAVCNPGVDGPFTMLDVEMGEFTVVVVDSMLKSVYMDEDTAVTRYQAIFQDLRAQAFPEDRSHAMIRQIAQEIWGAAAEEHDERLAQEQSQRFGRVHRMC